MVQSPPPDTPQVSPYLLYEDADAAIDYLVDVFGFTNTERMRGPDGTTLHAELRMGPGLVMLGRPGGDYSGPRRLGVNATQLVYVYVDDVDAHYAHATSRGAEIVRDLADQFYGDRVYGARDPEGHHWQFGTHVRDVATEDMHP